MIKESEFPIALQVWFTQHGDSYGKEGFTIFPILLHPRSRGTVRLQSVNPYDPPLIQPNYLADPWDVKVLVEGTPGVPHNT